MSDDVKKKGTVDSEKDNNNEPDHEYSSSDDKSNRTVISAVSRQGHFGESSKGQSSDSPYTNKRHWSSIINYGASSSKRVRVENSHDEETMCGSDYESDDQSQEINYYCANNNNKDKNNNDNIEEQPKADLSCARTNTPVMWNKESSFSKDNMFHIQSTSSMNVDHIVKGMQTLGPKMTDMDHKDDDDASDSNAPQVIFYKGHPKDALEESVALTSDKLILNTSANGSITERPQVNITGFTIFNNHSHLCAIDAGFEENDVDLFMSGYLKSTCNVSPEIDDLSIPVKDIGPINEWFIHGFTDRTKKYVSLSSEYAEYTLMRPSPEYSPFMNNLYEMIAISTVVVEYLEDNYYLQPTYENLLAVIRNSTVPDLGNITMTEELLHKHAQFMCEQVLSLESEHNEQPLITLPCIKKLIKLLGIRFSKRKLRTKLDIKSINMKTWTKATTTSLVRKTFENVFNQPEEINEVENPRLKRCGTCTACQLLEYGEYYACETMEKCCVRKLGLQVNEEHVEEDPSDEEDTEEVPVREHDDNDDIIPVKTSEDESRKIEWFGDPLKEESSKIYYEKIRLDDEELKIGDFVVVDTSLPNIPTIIARIIYIWKESNNEKSGYFHGQEFLRATNTILGEVGNPREIFLADRCCHGVPVSSILRIADVDKLDFPSDWSMLGGIEMPGDILEDDGKTYFYKKYYNRLFARFEDLPENPVCPNKLREHRFCPSCDRNVKKDAKNIPVVIDKLVQKSDIVTESNRNEWGMVKWRDFFYKKGCGVFLKPGTFRFKTIVNNNNTIKPRLENVNENIYTEYYRKSEYDLIGCTIESGGEPFCVGYIAAVTAKGEGPLISPQDIYLKVNVLYRPENTSSRFPQHEDLNVLYWSEEIREIPFSAVMGPCHLYYERNIPQQESFREWLEKDPNRFYFREAYDKRTGNIVSVPHHVISIGRVDKGKNKGKGKGKISKKTISEPQEKTVRPLRMLDVFAGCGGLAEGLRQSGIAVCKWAIEDVKMSSLTYTSNNRNCIVFNKDYNVFLRDVIIGATYGSSQSLPLQGDVELLCGSIPRQSESKSKKYTNLDNSLLATYLSYCDFYRPKYVILENASNFVTFKNGKEFKFTLQTLLEMGFNCTFGILHAGNYGLPQIKERLIILASAPGYELPLFPEPTHVFNTRACSLSANIDGRQYFTNINWDYSAPRRSCTIYDAISDLPEIDNGAFKFQMDYNSMPRCHFQRLMRSKDDNDLLRDHICKNMPPLIHARICRIPKTPGADWRDLPNISVTLSNETKCKVLQYRHYGQEKSSRARGVCRCAAGFMCDIKDRQEGTLIPWNLSHTAGHKNNNWAGIYGRVTWNGYFYTAVTDPEPMGKEGPILHPSQDRVVSLRECARTQGFPDTYKFCGSITEKHNQIGNAVPPPIGVALGRELMKAFVLSV